MSSGLSFGIVMAFAVNVLVSIYFFAVYKSQKINQSYLYWSLSCAIYALGIAMMAIAHTVNGSQVLNTIACIFLFAASFGLYNGLHEFEMAPGACRLLRRVRAVFVLGIATLLIASLFGRLVNVIACIGMALMFMITEGFFYQLKSPFRKVYLVLRALLLLHAFVLFLQGIVMLVQLLASSNSATLDLFNAVLFSHLILMVTTALILPVLHRSRVRFELETQANLDPTTGLLTRKVFLQQACDVIADNRFSEHSLLKLDIDHFKQVNAQYGYQFGEHVLSRVAKIVKEMLRESDLIGRSGAEEFAILLPGITVEQAQSVADRLRIEIGKQIFLRNKDVVEITVRIGIAKSAELVHDWDNLNTQADLALDTTPAAMHNRVYVFG